MGQTYSDKIALGMSRALTVLEEKSSVLWTYWANRLIDPATGAIRPELITESVLDDLLDDVFYCEKWPGI